MVIDDRLDEIARHPFRSKFHLRAHERAFVELRGMETVRVHARDFIEKGRVLDDAEREYVVDLIARWVERETGSAGRIPPA